MTVANIAKPYTFTNNTETADATKINADFDVIISALNTVITALNAAQGSRTNLADRLSVCLNDDGSLNPVSLPDGIYDSRSSRAISADAEMVVGDSIILVDTTAGDVNLTLLATTLTTATPTIVNVGLTGYKVVILPATGEEIMGLDAYELTVGGESVKLAPTSGKWWRVG